MAMTGTLTGDRDRALLLRSGFQTLLNPKTRKSRREVEYRRKTVARKGGKVHGEEEGLETEAGEMARAVQAEKRVSRLEDPHAGADAWTNTAEPEKLKHEAQRG